MSDFKFYTQERVRFSETDLQGVLHHSNYLRYFEVGRIEYMRNLGLLKNNDFVGPATVAVVEANCVYVKPLKFDDVFKLFVRVSDLKGASMIFEYELVGDGGEIFAEGFTKVATVDRAKFKPTRIPNSWHLKISDFEGMSDHVTKSNRKLNLPSLDGRARR